MENIGNRIKKLRKKVGLTQETLAVKIGIQRASVASYEVGKTNPSHKNLEKISKIFNVSMEYLINGDTNTPIPKSANFISILGNEMNIEPREYNIEKRLIPLHSSIDISKMYAIEINTTSMYPTLTIGDVIWCKYDRDIEIKDNLIVHYQYKDKIGISRIKIDEETSQIALVPDNIKEYKIIIIPQENKKYLKLSRIIGFSSKLEDKSWLKELEF